jgi:hypothetical protein
MPSIVLDSTVLGVKRPRSMNREGVMPALGDHQARMLPEASPEATLNGKRDRAILTTLLYHGLRCEGRYKLRSTRLGPAALVEVVAHRSP